MVVYLSAVSCILGFICLITGTLNMILVYIVDPARNPGRQEDRKERLWLNRLLLSTDLCRKRDLKACGGYGYGCLFREFLPRLERRGVTRQQMDLLLKANPDRLLGPVGGGPGRPASLTT